MPLVWYLLLRTADTVRKRVLHVNPNNVNLFTILRDNTSRRFLPIFAQYFRSKFIIKAWHARFSLQIGSLGQLRTPRTTLPSSSYTSSVRTVLLYGCTGPKSCESANFVCVCFFLHRSCFLLKLQFCWQMIPPIIQILTRPILYVTSLTKPLRY